MKGTDENKAVANNLPTIKGVQLCELEIMERFASICNENSLKYYIVGGTLLGAVRHGGFIPWDDDVDIAMPRQDYEAFASLCKNDGVLKNDYFYQDHLTDKGYFLPYAKIRKVGTFAAEPAFSDTKMEERGVFIDIFPLDECPPKSLRLKIKFKLLSVMNTRGRVLSGAQKPKKKGVLYNLIYAAVCLIPQKKLNTVRNRIIRKLSKKADGRHVGSFAGAYRYPKEIFDKSIYGDGVKLTFEGKVFFAPDRYDEQLKQIFGDDYLVLPSEEKRFCHLDIDNCKI